MQSSYEVNASDSESFHVQTVSAAEPHAERFDRPRTSFIQLDNTLMAVLFEYLAPGNLVPDQTFDASLPQDPHPGNRDNSLFSGHLAPSPVNPSPTAYDILQQNNFQYVLQFNRDRHMVDFTPLTVTFSHHAALSGERGIVGIDLLLHPGGTMELSDALTAIHLPEDVAAVVTLWILFPDCKKYSTKVRMRRKINKLPVTVADLAVRIARAFKGFLKKEPEWAAENAADLSMIVLTKFYRVSKGSWQIELGKRTSARDTAPYTSLSF